MDVERTSDPAPPLPRAAAHREIAPFIAVAVAVVALDQATKALVRARLAEGDGWPGAGALLRITHVENSGAAFGMLQGAGPFLLITTVVGIVAVVAYLFLTPSGGRLHGTALAFILGGAAGNLIDRAARGTVTDFIDPTRYPAFNLADSAIVVGVAALAWLTLRERDGAP